MIRPGGSSAPWTSTATRLRPWRGTGSPRPAPTPAATGSFGAGFVVAGSVVAGSSETGSDRGWPETDAGGSDTPGHTRQGDASGSDTPEPPGPSGAGGSDTPGHPVLPLRVSIRDARAS